MNAALRSRLSLYALLWGAATAHANLRLSAIVRWGVLILVAIVGIALAFTQGARAALMFVWCAGCAAILAMWIGRFIPGAVKLNSPANAKLVPGMRRRLVELAALVWFAAIVGLMIAPYANGAGPGVWILWVAIGTLGCGLGAAGHQGGAALVCVACVGSTFLSKLPAPLHGLLSGPLVPALSPLLYAGLVMVVVREIFAEGQDRHWRMIDRRARIADAPGKADPLIEQIAGARTRGWYAASLRRACARRDSRRLVLHALGPAHHLGELLAGLGFFANTLAVVGVFARWRTGDDFLEGAGWIFACLLMIVPASIILRLNGLAAAYPGEQALVRLAPAAPGAAASFNRDLGRGLALQALKGWALAAGAALSMAALAGAGPSILVRVASICCLMLPIVAAPLRNHAVRTRLPGAVLVLLMVGSAGVSIGLGFALRAVTGLPAMPVAAIVSIAIASYAVTHGLRVMTSSPFAFPAGRMG